MYQSVFIHLSRTWVSKVRHEGLVSFSGVCICRDVRCKCKGKPT